MTIITFNWWELLNPAVTLIAGLIALWVFVLSNRHRRQDAATLILMDIRRAEDAAFSLRDKGAVEKDMKPFPTSENWARSKHLLVRELTVDELATIDRFFDGCEQIETARRSMMELFQATLIAKATSSQERILELAKIEDEDERTKKVKAVIEACNSNSFYFDADEPRGRVIKALSLLGRPSTSVAFSKLVKISKSH